MSLPAGFGNGHRRSSDLRRSVACIVGAALRGRPSVMYATTGGHGVPPLQLSEISPRADVLRLSFVIQIFGTGDILDRET